MLLLTSIVLRWFYLLLPLGVFGWASYRGRRERSWNRVVPLIGMLVWGTAIGLGLVLIYARATEGHWSLSQIAITSYFIISLLLVLRLIRSGIDWLGERITRKARGKRGHLFVAVSVGVAKTVLLFAIGLPMVMAVLMTYRPKVMPALDPEQIMDVKFEPVAFETSDGITIAGWWIGSTSPSSTLASETVLVCHGLGASKSNQLFMARELIHRGWNVLAIDHRAHGESGGQLSTFGDHERFDVLAAVGWLREHRPQQTTRIFGMGTSMGAAALIVAAADDSAEGQHIDALVVYGTYDDMGDLTHTVIDRAFPTPIDWMLFHLGPPIASVHSGADIASFAPAKLVSKIWPRPILFIHGIRDSIIDFDHGRHLYEAALQPKQRIWLSDGDHNNILEDEPTAKQAADFLSRAGSVL